MFLSSQGTTKSNTWGKDHTPRARGIMQVSAYNPPIVQLTTPPLEREIQHGNHGLPGHQHLQG